MAKNLCSIAEIQVHYTHLHKKEKNYNQLSKMQRWMYLSVWALLWVQQTLVFFEEWSVLGGEAGVLPLQQVLFCLNTDIPEEED